MFWWYSWLVFDSEGIPVEAWWMRGCRLWTGELSELIPNCGWDWMSNALEWRARLCFYKGVEYCSLYSKINFIFGAEEIFLVFGVAFSDQPLSSIAKPPFTLKLWSNITPHVMNLALFRSDWERNTLKPEVQVCESIIESKSLLTKCKIWFLVPKSRDRSILRNGQVRLSKCRSLRQSNALFVKYSISWLWSRGFWSE